MAAEFISRNLQSTTKNDHIIIFYLKEPTNNGFSKTYCWSEDETAHFLQGIRETLTTSVADDVIERKVVGGVYYDRAFTAEGETVSYYIQETTDFLDLEDSLLVFRRFHELTTAPPSITNKDQLMLNNRIERLVFNCRNKCSIVVCKNEAGEQSLSVQITHPQDLSKLTDILRKIEDIVPFKHRVGG